MSARFAWAKRVLEWAERKWGKMRPDKYWPGTCLDKSRTALENMNTPSAGQIYVIAEEFDKALKLVRHALAERELSITSEWDTTDTRRWGSSREPQRSGLLLVDSPILVFEAMALDRSAAALFPLHVRLSADGSQTQAVFVEPASFFALRPPVGAAGPLEEMKSRIKAALESVAARSEVRHRQI